MRKSAPADRIPRRHGRVLLTPAGRIRQLRLRVALFFALISALAVITLGVVAIRADDAWQPHVDSDLQAQAEDFASDLSYDEDGDLNYPDPKQGAYDCPPVVLFSVAGDQVTQVAAASRPCLLIPAADFQAVAAQAARNEEVTITTITTHGRHMRLSAQPVPGADPNDVGAVVVVARDITGDLNSHERLIAILAAVCAGLIAAAALAGYWLSGRAVRPALEALDQQEAFFADAAHDLRTPVTSMRVLAETGLRGEADATEIMRRTLRQSTRMSELVDDLLTRARLRAGALKLKREPLRLDQLVDAVVADTPAQGHTVSVRTEPVVVLGDAGLLRRAVANLIGNALAHGHAPDRRAEVDVTVTADGIVAVDDAGPGIPPELAKPLFERFHSGTSSSGLGLSIATWVAHAHGGSLTVTASTRGGARFVLRLPVSKRL